ncbi:MAG: Fic family protein [Betaproteobacteria bacterium AqS2]|uniref:Protein adenylyltransferase n=1 Tax=Candidatus Amphirhobacter heronislandensis TaxID=1732024 RepID=A0A930Y0W4_9GAMM|nr:Fic family protein [Betaproteobacteria bacterium AqS2]
MIKELPSIYPGKHIPYNSYTAFLPADLYSAAELELDGKVREQAQKALWQLGRLAHAIEETPDPDAFVDACKLKEAVETSRIEGTRADAQDIYVARLTGKADCDPLDIAEIEGYARALDRALELRKELPLGCRLLREAHAALLDQPRGHHKAPGEFRNVEVWIGGRTPESASYNPPPPGYVPQAMDNLEKFMQDDDVAMDSIVKLALLHYHFEAIHPFRDGNGRAGRMIVALFLQAKGWLERPALTISFFLFGRRWEYYSHLNDARQSSQGVNDWLLYFITGIACAAEIGVDAALAMAELKADCVAKIKASGGRQIEADLAFLDRLFKFPAASIASIEKEQGVPRHVASRMLQRMAALGILVKYSASKKSSVHTFKDYIDVFANNRKIVPAGATVSMQS